MWQLPFYRCRLPNKRQQHAPSNLSTHHSTQSAAPHAVTSAQLPTTPLIPPPTPGYRPQSIPSHPHGLQKTPGTPYHTTKSHLWQLPSSPSQLPPTTAHITPRPTSAHTTVRSQQLCMLNPVRATIVLPTATLLPHLATGPRAYWAAPQAAPACACQQLTPGSAVLLLWTVLLA